MAATPESPRLTPLPPKEWSRAAGEALAPLLPPTGRPKGGNGPKGLNALGVLARYPELALAYNTFSGQVMYGSTLTSAPTRAAGPAGGRPAGDSEYEWRQHVASAGDNGVDPDEVARIAAGTEAPEWSDLERALLHAADELLGDALIADETWSTLAAEFDDRQLMDVVFTVGAYDVLAMALRTFGAAGRRP